MNVEKYFIKIEILPGMGIKYEHTWDPNTGEVEAEGSQFKTSLGYKVILRIAWATQWDLVSNKQTNKKSYEHHRIQSRNY
jgi:hypothetical protein